MVVAELGNDRLKEKSYKRVSVQENRRDEKFNNKYKKGKTNQFDEKYAQVLSFYIISRQMKDSRKENEEVEII